MVEIHTPQEWRDIISKENIKKEEKISRLEFKNRTRIGTYLFIAGAIIYVSEKTHSLQGWDESEPKNNQKV